MMDTVERSRSFISQQVDAQSTQLGERLHATAEDLRRISSELQQNGGLAPAAGITGQGIDMLDRLAEYLQSSDGEKLLADAEAFARARPLTVAGAALVAGLATARFLKASSAARNR